MHYMSPSGDVAILILAGLIDYSSAGATNFRDRLASLLGLAALYDGFHGSDLAAWTTGKAATGVAMILDHANGKYYIAGASANIVVSLIVSAIGAYYLLVLIPNNATTSKWLGPAAGMTFGRGAKSEIGGGKTLGTSKQRMNRRLWLTITILAIMADVPQGSWGNFLRWFIQYDTGMVSTIPHVLFGA